MGGSQAGGSQAGGSQAGGSGGGSNPYPSIRKYQKVTKQDAYAKFNSGEITTIERKTRMIYVDTLPTSSPSGVPETNPDFMVGGKLSYVELFKTAVVADWQLLCDYIKDELEEVYNLLQGHIGNIDTRQDVYDKLAELAYWFADSRVGATYEAVTGISWANTKQFLRDVHMMTPGDQPQLFQNFYTWLTAFIPVPNRHLQASLPDHHMVFSDWMYDEIGATIENNQEILLGTQQDVWWFAQSATVKIPLGWSIDIEHRHTWELVFAHQMGISYGLFAYELTPASGSGANAHVNWCQYYPDGAGYKFNLGLFMDIEHVVQCFMPNPVFSTDTNGRKFCEMDLVVAEAYPVKYTLDIYPAGDPYITGEAAGTVYIEHKMDDVLIVRETIADATAWLGTMTFDKLICYRGVRALYDLTLT